MLVLSRKSSRPFGLSLCGHARGNLYICVITRSLDSVVLLHGRRGRDMASRIRLIGIIPLERRTRRHDKLGISIRRWQQQCAIPKTIENSRGRNVIPLLTSRGHVLGWAQWAENKEAGIRWTKGQDGSHSKLVCRTGIRHGRVSTRFAFRAEISVSRSLFSSVNLLG